MPPAHRTRPLYSRAMPIRLPLALAVVSLAGMTGAASASAATYVGKDRDGRARITLQPTVIRITLSATNARRSARRSVGLQCGTGNYGRGDRITVLWPSARTRTLTLPEEVGPVDRCRLSLGQGGTIIARMRMRKV